MGGQLDSIEQFYEFIAELKTHKRHLATNFYLDEKELASLIEDEKIFYYYVPGKYINLWKAEWDFIRLYYYVADIDSYDVSAITGKIVCDLFFRKETEENIAIKSSLERIGFAKYALFHKYEKKRNPEDTKIPSGNVVIGTVNGFYELLLECFNIYTDLIPEPEKAEGYLNKEICYSVVDEAGEIAGGAVITKKGFVETEEFIFVKTVWRGRGIARMLREYCYANAGKEITRFVSWVRDDNESSWCQLQSLGYKKSNVYKITMIRG